MAVSPVKALLDTSVYLSFLRKDGEIHDLNFLRRPTLLYLSSVVFTELYAGARDHATVRLLERFYRTVDRLNRVIAPDPQVWLEAARVLQRFRTRYGFEARGRDFPMISSLRSPPARLVRLCSHKIERILNESVKFEISN